MQDGARLLVLSNGLAEDLVGAALAAAWQRGCPDGEVIAAPLLGDGRAYQQVGVRLLAPGMQLPSGGFTRLGLSAFLADWQAGWWSATRAYVNRLHNLRSWLRRSVQADWHGWVCVGDVYLLTLGWWALRTPAWFVPTAKSQLIRGHLRVEMAWLRGRARAIFARDEPTAQALAAAGLPARYLGNPLLDVGGAGSVWAARARGAAPATPAAPAGVPLAAHGTVGLLPGSRQDWQENLEKLLQVVATVRSSWASSDRVVAAGARPASGAAVRFVVAAPASERAADAVERVPFTTLLEQADLVVGLAGTAHEQAAALGIPVVAAPWGRLQYTERFARAQQRLLGPALLLCPPQVEAVSRAVAALLGDPARRRWMGAAGRARMGEAGAVARIAAAIVGAKEGMGEHDP